MHATNTTATPCPTFNAPPPNGQSSSRFFGAYVRNSPAGDTRWSPHARGQKPISTNPDLPIPCPVFCGENWKDYFYSDDLKNDGPLGQRSLEEAWASIQERWRIETPSEEHFIQLLTSDIWQTDTCRALVPLIEKALLRLINSLDTVVERPGEFVKIICNLPSTQWANALGEHVKFPPGHFYEFVQQQVTRSNLLEQQMIEAGELLDNAPWKAVRELTQSVRDYVAPHIEGPLNKYLRQLEDCCDVRPSYRETQTLVAGLVVALKETPQELNMFWPESLVVAAQKLSDRLAAIEIVDNRPDRSWLEEIVDPQALQASLSKVATPMNTALTKLGSMSFSDAADELKSSISTVLTKTGNFFTPDAGSAPTLGQLVDSSPAESALLSAMKEIEKKSNFFDEVVTTGPRYTGGFWGKALYIANALDTVGLLGVAEKIRPHLPAAPVLAPVVVLPESPEASQTTSTVMGPLDFEQMAKTIGDAFSRIDDALTFPSASAAVLEDRLGDLQQSASLLDALKEIELVGPLQVTPISWWQPIAHQLSSVLLRLSTALGPYSLGAATAAVQLLRDNPRASATAALVTVSALYNEYCQSLQDPTAPGTALPQEPESPALHHEREGDAIERILAEPVAAGQSSLYQALFKRTLQSNEHDLLDDEQLINDFVQMLQQPSPRVPEKTFLELIRETQAAAHAGPTITEPVTNTHRIRKRDTAAADTNEVSLPPKTHDSEPTPDIQASESEKVAALTHYLNTMGELNNAVPPTEEELDDGPSDSPITTAKQVISLIRNRRAVLWTDASRADGDRQLVERYASALTNYSDSNVSYNAATVVIPMHSTLGQCWLNFIIAIKNPFFVDWARRAKLDLATVKISTAHNTLTAKVEGVDKTFTLHDDSGWANVAGPILTAAGVVDPTYIGVAYPTGSPVPLALVSGFHGERSAPNRSQARERAQELEANPVFPQIQPDDPLRPLESRSEAQIETQRQRLGDLYTHHALITGLNDLINDKAEDTPVNLNDCTLAAHKDSLFARKHPQEARRMVTAQRFISAMGWKVPNTVGEVSNLIKVLSFVLPEHFERADYKGALGYGWPLTDAHLQTIRETVQRFEKPVTGGLLNTLLHSKSVTSPAQGLNIALNSDKAIELGQTLEASLNAFSTPNSATEWVMAALLLDLDPTPGQPRNHVGGYNLAQSANWGAQPSAVVSRLQAHLVASGKVTATHAPVAAYHLLSAFAPEFLVRNMPDNLVCGSHTWTSFRIAVARIEQLDPGAAIRMTFEQVMNYGSTDPITVGQEIAAQSASVDPLIDWAIANGNLVADASDTYTTGQLDIAREKFNSVRAQMAQAGDSLSVQVPTREGLALAELERVFGKGLPYADLCFRRKNIPQNVPASMYSLLDLYITGQLKPLVWKSYNDQILIRTVESKLNQLKNVDSLFKETFTAYFDNLRSGSESVFKYLISQLPLEDRQSLEFGRQTFYSVRSAIDKDINRQTQEEIEAHKGRHGILIRSEYKGKITYYEVFPSAVEIRKNPGLPEHLKLNGEINTFGSMKNYIEKQCATRQSVDWDAYEKGTVPREGVTSNVIIEEIKPITQQATFYPAGYNFDSVPDVFSPSSRIDYLAKVVVDEHFVVGRDKLENLARGSTNSENEKALKIKLLDFFAGLVPFKSCIDNISQGKVVAGVFDCLLDAAGFVIPGGLAAGQAVKVAKSAGKFAPKALQMTWIMSSTLVSSANPLDGMGDLFRFGKTVVFRLGTTAYRAAGLGISQIKNLYGATKAIDHSHLIKRADIEQGAASKGMPGQTSPVTALFKDGKWYAYDASRNRPFGPPLDDFTPASSIPLEPVTFNDGSTALTPSRLFDTDPHTIRRFSGEVDIVVGDDVYRFNPNQPNTLTDIRSASRYGKLEGFDAVCSTGGKSKRGVTCLSKEIQITRTPELQRAQALEHKRLYPSKGTAAQVIHERRIYKLDGVLGDAKAAPFIENIQFKSETTGSIINDPHFGFPDKQIDDELEKSTRIVRVNAIVNGIDDMRDVRAFQVDIPGRLYGKYNYLVAEVDAGLFYYCSYDKKTRTTLYFHDSITRMTAWPPT